jgi:hypothetical protein
MTKKHEFRIVDSRPKWDVFISHASEDKAAVAAPLAEELRNYCLSVWLDKWVLSPGDSLRRKIDEGISRSRLGVVVLSHAFFAKDWPQAELDALYTLAVSGKRSIVPVWHEIEADDVSYYSPLLAALLALPTTRGIEPIAEEITRKLGPIGRPFTMGVGPRPLAVVPDLEALVTAIRQSEDIPGSYAKRRVTVSFPEGATPHEQEIRQGVRLLITHEPLTFPVRTSNLLAMCVDSFIRIYDESSSKVTGIRLDLWRKEDTAWNTGIYVSPEEASHICDIIGVSNLMDLRGGFPNDMLDLGAMVLATKAVPRILFEFFRRQQRDRKDYTERIHELLALPTWTFGVG